MSKKPVASLLESAAAFTPQPEPPQVMTKSAEEIAAAERLHKYITRLATFHPQPEVATFVGEQIHAAEAWGDYLLTVRVPAIMLINMLRAIPE